jgi:hypothetical protein
LLESGLRKKSDGVQSIRGDPGYVLLRGDPSFPAILRRIGFPATPTKSKSEAKTTP